MPDERTERTVGDYTRHVCTAADPYDPKVHGRPVQHPDAKVVGGSSCGAADDFKCPHCGTEWRDWYDDNSY